MGGTHSKNKVKPDQDWPPIIHFRIPLDFNATISKGPSASIKNSQFLLDPQALPRFLAQQYPKADKFWVCLSLHKRIEDEQTRAHVNGVVRALMPVQLTYETVTSVQYESNVGPTKEESEAASSKVRSMIRDLYAEQGNVVTFRSGSGCTPDNGISMELGQFYNVP